jgi:hypothetical protein
MAPSSMGSLFGTTLLSSMAGTVLGSMVAQHFFNSHPDALQRFAEGPHAADDLGQSSADGDQVSEDASPHDSDLSGGVDDGGIDFGGTFDV